MKHMNTTRRDFLCGGAAVTGDMPAIWSVCNMGYIV